MQRDMETILQLAIGSITIYTCTHIILTTSNLGQFKSANNPDKLNCSVDINAILANKLGMSPPLCIKLSVSFTEHINISILFKFLLY